MCGYVYRVLTGDTQTHTHTQFDIHSRSYMPLYRRTLHGGMCCICDQHQCNHIVASRAISDENLICDTT